MILDLEQRSDAKAFRELVATADIVLEGERPGRLGDLGLDADDLRPSHPALVWVSVTPFGRDDPRRDEQFTDLTVLAGGGPVWSCGYDDHTLPPVRGGGNQGYHTGCVWAVIGALTAVLLASRHRRGPARRREPARGGERHHRGRHLQLARGREHRAAPDGPTRRGGAHDARAHPVVRRPVVPHRVPTPTQGGVPEAARVAR